jgi:hypothetical protein
MLIIALFLAAYALVLGAKGIRDTLSSLPRSNSDWVWY